MKSLRKLTFLHVLVIMMGIAALVRFSDFRIAVAETEKPAEKVETTDADKPVTAATAAPDAAPAVPAASAAPAGPEPISLDNLTEADLGVLEQLSVRRRQLDEQERKLGQREALLKAAQDELKKKYGELDKLRAEIKSLLDQQSQEEEARLRSLVKVYENMKPAAAAGILNTLDMRVLMQVMGRMSERKMSPILAAMNPERAREVTTRLASQKQLPDAPPPATQANRAAEAPPEDRTMDKAAAAAERKDAAAE